LISQTGERMTEEKHKERHLELDRALDELVADFIFHTNKLPSKTSLMELMNWSFEQTKIPTKK